MEAKTTLKNERAGAINGVPGRYKNVIAWPDGRHIANQEWVSDSRPVKGYGAGGMMKVRIRHDDNCKNCHETFSITAEVVTNESKRQNDIAAGGCMHDEIARVFPELNSLIKWHLVTTDGPLHYIGNTTFHAGVRDHNGLLKDERRQIRNGKTGKLSWHLVAVDQEGNEVELYNLEEYQNSDDKPECPYRLEYRPWCTVGEGKERQLEFARSSAVWPDATDEQLSLPKDELTKLLKDRLPALMAEFKSTVESCGFIYSM